MEPMDLDQESDLAGNEFINIVIQDIYSNKFNQLIKINTKIGDLKRLISSKVNIEPDDIKMIYSGEILNNDKTLQNYDVKHDNVIHVIKRQYRSNVNFVNRSAIYPKSRAYLMSRNSLLRRSLITFLNRNFSINIQRLNSPSENIVLSNADIRDRMNQLRHLINYGTSNIQGLRNPNRSFRRTMNPTQFYDEDHQFTPDDYVECFSNVLNFIQLALPALLVCLETWINTCETSHMLTMFRYSYVISSVIGAIIDLIMDQKNKTLNSSNE